MGIPEKYFSRINIAALAALILLLLPFLYISVYVHPIADDFTYAVKGRTYGIFDNLAGEYLNWNGRYFSNLLVILSPLNYSGITGYKLFPVIIILLITISFHIFTSAFVKEALSKTQVAIVSLILTLLYMHQMPDLAEGIYWYTGSVTYMAGNILLLPFIALLYRFYNKDYFFKNPAIHFSLLIMLLFIINGLNETHVIALWILLITVNLIHFINLRKVHAPMLTLLVLSVLFSLAVILSPGNTVRESNFTGNHQLLQSLYMSAAQTGRFLFEWCSSFPLLISSVLFYKLNLTLCEKDRLFASSFYLKPWQSLALLLLVIFAGAFPAYWGTGILGQHRTMNVSYLLFLAAWFINLNVFYNRFPFSSYTPGRLTSAILTFLFIISVFFTGNLYTVSSDIASGRASRFDDQMYGRYEKLSEAKDTAFLAPVADPPESIFVLDISEYPGHWINKGYALYFGKKDLVILPGE